MIALHFGGMHCLAIQRSTCFIDTDGKIYKASNGIFSTNQRKITQERIEVLAHMKKTTSLKMINYHCLWIRILNILEKIECIGVNVENIKSMD